MISFLYSANKKAGNFFYYIRSYLVRISFLAWYNKRGYILQTDKCINSSEEIYE